MTDELVPFDADRLPDMVIDLAGYRLTHGRPTKPSWEACKHRHMIYSKSDRRIDCEDCKRTIEPFDALMGLVGGLDEMLSEVRQRQQAATSAIQHSLVSRAAKTFDDYWRGRNMAPCCPHCSQALLPEDITRHGLSAVGREYELARRKREKGS